MECRICSNTSNLNKYLVKEMMFGLREEFEYFQCPNCECLQIVNFPKDMAKYYPSNYYSFTKDKKSVISIISGWMKSRRNRFAMFDNDMLGWLIHSIFPSVNPSFNAIVLADAHKTHKILDVGCGSGYFLKNLAKIGFKNLHGVDPFLNENLIEEQGVRLEKKSIHQVKSKKDIITFNHSFEHLSDPLETLKMVSDIMNPGGQCIIRIPTVSSYAWKHYGVNWVQLDAPRHFFLHSIKSVKYLANQVNLTVENVVYDSNEFQFLGSERYIKNIPLRSKEKNKDIFSNSEIKSFKSRAKKLNYENKGDAIAVFLRKP